MKTIVMYEGNQPHTFSASKLRTPLQGGGTCDWVPEDEVQLTTKFVSENGTYNAASDEFYGFSQVTVNVPGGNGSADSSGKPNTSGDIKPGGAGSAVTGTDPETGEEVVVGVDENGNIVQTQIPYGIKIVTPPTKTDYVYQETMDYTGIMVKLTNKNGDTYTDVDHPSGWYVNPADLIFPVTEAPAAGGSSGGSTAYTVVQNETFTRDGHAWAVNVLNSTARAVRFIFSDRQVIHYISDSSYRYSTQSLPDGLYSELNADPVQINGKIYYHGGGINALTGSTLTMSQEIAISETFGDAFSNLQNEFNALCVEYSYGEKSGGNLTATIPVQWVNPYTGDTHQDTFEITSKPASGDAHTSTGSSGVEGSGGGGTF